MKAITIPFTSLHLPFYRPCEVIKSFDKLVKSINEVGTIAPIVVSDRTHIIADGVSRYWALYVLGITHTHVVCIDSKVSQYLDEQAFVSNYRTFHVDEKDRLSVYDSIHLIKSLKAEYEKG